MNVDTGRDEFGELVSTQNRWLWRQQMSLLIRCLSLRLRRRVDRLHKTRIYYKSGAEEDSSRTGTRRPAMAASASTRA